MRQYGYENKHDIMVYGDETVYAWATENCGMNWSSGLGSRRSRNWCRSGACAQSC